MLCWIFSQEAGSFLACIWTHAETGCVMLWEIVRDCLEPLDPSAFFPLPFKGLALVFWAFPSAFPRLSTSSLPLRGLPPDSINWTSLGVNTHPVMVLGCPGAGPMPRRY
jgi:hypothetical protein